MGSFFTVDFAYTSVLSPTLWYVAAFCRSVDFRRGEAWHPSTSVDPSPLEPLGPHSWLGHLVILTPLRYFLPSGILLRFEAAITESAVCSAFMLITPTLRY